jgi:hypothetical protein
MWSRSVKDAGLEILCGKWWYFIELSPINYSANLGIKYIKYLNSHYTEVYQKVNLTNAVCNLIHFSQL